MRGERPSSFSDILAKGHALTHRCRRLPTAACVFLGIGSRVALGGVRIGLIAIFFLSASSCAGRTSLRNFGGLRALLVNEPLPPVLHTSSEVQRIHDRIANEVEYTLRTNAQPAVDPLSGRPALARYSWTHTLEVSLLRRTLWVVPQRELWNFRWVDSLPTSAVPGVGITFNRERVARLMWQADSSWFWDATDGFRRIVTLRPSRWMALVGLLHEQGHLAFARIETASKHAEAVKECAADMLAGFGAVALSPQLTHGEAEPWGLAEIPRLAELELADGDWVAGDGHPSREQRRACISRGVDLARGLRAVNRVVGVRLLSSASDSLLDNAVESEGNLVSLLMQESSALLAIPEEVRTSMPVKRFDGDGDAVPALAAVQRAIDSLETPDPFAALRGRPVSVGGTEFPGSRVFAVVEPATSPWRCAVLSDSTNTGSMMCYVFSERFKSSMVAFFAARSIEAAVPNGHRSIARIESPMPRSTRYGLVQWLITVGNRPRGVLSIYHQPAPWDDGTFAPELISISLRILNP